MLSPSLYKKVSEEAKDRLLKIKEKEAEIKKLQEEIAFLQIEYDGFKTALGK